MHFLTILALTQMPWTTTLPPKGLAINFLRPKFDAGGTSLTSGTAYFTGRFPIDSEFSLRFELGYAHLDASGTTSSAISNPYVGFELARAKWTFGLGFRPALAPDDEIAPEIGLYSDITQIEAWLPHVATLSTRFAYHNRAATGMIVDIGFAPAGWIPTQGGDLELVVTHYGSLGYRGSKVWGALGLGGVLDVTADGDYGERSFYQLGATVGLTQGQVRPALHFLLPLDDAITSDLDFMVGLGVGIAIK